MNVAAVALIGGVAIVGGALWYVSARQRDQLTILSATVAASVPILVLGIAGLLAVNVGRPSETLQDLATALGMVATVAGGGAVATAILRLADRVPTPGTPTPEPDHEPPLTISDPSTLRGGAWIGALERIAVTTTLLAGWPEGLAVVLAVKGLGRYPELRRPAAAERFIVGSFVSVLWAVAVYGVLVAVRT